MSGTPGNPTQLDTIVVYAPRQLPDGSSLSAGHNYDVEGVYLEHYDANDKLLNKRDFSYEEYEKYRRENPDLDLPEIKKPKKRAPGTNGNGNTVGRVVGESGTSGKPASEANPEVETETAAEDDTGNKILDGVQLGLDVVGLIPVVGEVADIGNGIISLFRGDFVGAGLSFASAIPFAGYAATAGKVARKGIQAASTTAEATAKAGRQAAKPKGGVGGNRGGNKKGGKGRGKGRCMLRPYKPDTCAAEGKTGHHVVPDRVFRRGKRSGPGRNQISDAAAGIDGLSEAEGLVICVEGATPKPHNEHGKIHKRYDDLEKGIGLAGNPPGTAPLLALELVAAKAVSQVTKCSAAKIAAQLRAYHELKGMGPDFIVRADKGGTLANKLHPDDFGPPGSGVF